MTMGFPLVLAEPYVFFLISTSALPDDGSISNIKDADPKPDRKLKKTEFCKYRYVVIFFMVLVPHVNCPHGYAL